ncbi:topoisomerase IV [Eubacteriales bacterium OttesenSCG-928-N13]|nr:topoisomerase IV [Eubacteriales bacterium OttesenSCG-928-N13]
MEHTIPVALAIIAILVTALVVAMLRKRKRVIHNCRESAEMFASANMPPASGKHSDLFDIPIELLPATTKINESDLIEITDQTVVARISQAFPAVAQIATRTFASNAANTALQQTANAANAAVKSVNEAIQGGDIYRAILSPGKNLVQSRSMGGAFRGFAYGPKNIREHANLVRINMQKASEVTPANISKATNAANMTANVMNVVSLIVGQYYMSVIDTKLEALSKNVSKISDFQNREFKSRILSVISLVSEISQFSTEILEDDSQRMLKISTLENIKATTTELLGQVNITIADITKKNTTPAFSEYETAIVELKALVGFQNVLLSVLEEISKLTYLLGKGSISSDQSYALYRKYAGLSVQTRTLLSAWHSKQVETLRIDLSKERVSKTGIEAIISTPLGWIDERHNYKAIKKPIAREIVSQADIAIDSVNQTKDVYADNVELIIKNGKYYYLPNQQMQ